MYGKGSLQWTFEPFEPCNAVRSGILTRLTVGGRNFTFAVGEGKSRFTDLRFSLSKVALKVFAVFLAAGESEFHESKPVERTEASKVNPLLKSY